MKDQPTMKPQNNDRVEPSDADVERVADALKPFDNRYRVDGRVRPDGQVEWFISDRDLPAGVFVFGPTLDQDACRTEFKRRRARAAINSYRAEPSDEDVERVARAMGAAAGSANPFADDPADEPNAEDDREWWRKMARAAIAALRAKR